MKRTDKIKGVLMGLPTLNRPTNVHWAMGFHSCSPPINYQVKTAIIEGQEVAQARNGVCDAGLKEGCEFAFFIGDDVQVPPHALQQLIYRMEHNPQLAVVGGVYCSKSQPPAPLVFRGNGAGSYWDWAVGEFFWVTGLGMDCTLIRLEALKQMGSGPWFKTIRNSGYLDGVNQSEAWTEDLYFCDQLLKKTQGWWIGVDSMVMCVHWQFNGGCSWTPYQLRTDSLPYLKAARFSQDVIQPIKQILDLGCGPIHHNFQGEGLVTRVDIRDECSPDWRGDIFRLPFDAQTFDVVWSSHTLEHIPRTEVDETLAEWVRVLKLGGELRLVIPNISWAATQILAGNVSWDALNVLYGSQEYRENFHRVGFTPATLTAAMAKQGIDNIQVRLSGYNIVAKGTKCQVQC